jgi:hypothetical protein
VRWCADSIDYYAVLREGVQRIGEVAADLIRFTYPVGLGEVPAVAPARSHGAGQSTPLPSSTCRSA